MLIAILVTQQYRHIVNCTNMYCTKYRWNNGKHQTHNNGPQGTLRCAPQSPSVVTNALGRHLTIPMHKPIKPVYIKRLVELIEAAE